MTINHKYLNCLEQPLAILSYIPALLNQDNEPMHEVMNRDLLKYALSIEASYKTLAVAEFIKADQYHKFCNIKFEVTPEQFNEFLTHPKFTNQYCQSSMQAIDSTFGIIDLATVQILKDCLGIAKSIVTEQQQVSQPLAQQEVLQKTTATMEEAETRVAATEKAEALITKANVIEEEALEAVTVIELAKIEAEMLKTEAKAIIEADVIETGAAHTTASVNSTVIELIERALQEELQHIAKVEDANLIDTQNSEIIGQNQENISDL